MAVQHHLGEVVNSLFRLKKRWRDIDPESKEAAFFIINQYSAKKHPANAHALNSKALDPAIGSEIWSLFYSDTRIVPDWFWKKPKKIKYENEFDSLDEKDQWIINNFYKEDLERYKLQLEWKENSHQTAKKRKNSKISKLNNKHASIF